MQIMVSGSNGDAVALGISAVVLPNFADKNPHEIRIQVYEENGKGFLRFFYDKVQYKVMEIGLERLNDQEGWYKHNSHDYGYGVQGGDNDVPMDGNRMSYTGTSIWAGNKWNHPLLNQKITNFKYFQYQGWPGDDYTIVRSPHIDEVTTTGSQNMGRLATFREYDVQFNVQYQETNFAAYSSHIRSVLHIGNHELEKMPAVYINRNTLDTIQIMVTGSDGVGGGTGRGVPGMVLPGLADKLPHHIRIQVFEEDNTGYLRLFYDRVQYALIDIGLEALNDLEGTYSGNIFGPAQLHNGGSQNDVFTGTDTHYVGTTLWMANKWNHPFLDKLISNFTYQKYQGFPADSIIVVPPAIPEITTTGSQNMGKLHTYRQYDVQFYLKYEETNFDAYSGHVRSVIHIGNHETERMPAVYINPNTLDVMQVQVTGSDGLNQGGSYGVSGMTLPGLADKQPHHIRIQVFEEFGTGYLRLFYDHVQYALIDIGLERLNDDEGWYSGQVNTNAVYTNDYNDIDHMKYTGTTLWAGNKWNHPFLDKTITDFLYQEYQNFPNDSIITVSPSIPYITTTGSQNMGKLQTFRQYDVQFYLKYEVANFDAYSGHVRSVIHIGNHEAERMPAVYINPNTLDTIQIQVTGSDGNGGSTGIPGLVLPGMADKNTHHIRIQVYQDFDSNGDLTAFVRLFYDKVQYQVVEIGLDRLNDDEGYYLGTGNNGVYVASNDLKRYTGTTLWAGNKWNHPFLDKTITNFEYAEYDEFPDDSIITVPAQFSEVTTTGSQNMGKIATFREYDVTFKLKYNVLNKAANSGHVRSVIHIGNHEAERIPAVYINPNTLDVLQVQCTGSDGNGGSSGISGITLPNLADESSHEIRIQVFEENNTGYLRLFYDQTEMQTVEIGLERLNGDEGTYDGSGDNGVYVGTGTHYTGTTLWMGNKWNQPFLDKTIQDFDYKEYTGFPSGYTAL